MALVILAVLAAHQHDAVVTAIQRVGDPDRVDGTQTTHRDDADIRIVVVTVHAGHVERRVGVVLAGQDQDARLLGELVRYIDGLDLGADGVDRVVLERNHPHRAGAHTGAATAATRFVEQREALFVFVDGAERAFHGAAFALGTAFQTHGGERQVAGARVGRLAETGVFHRLNRFHCGAGGIFLRLHDVHRATHRAGGVDAGTAGFIREADEVRVGEAMLELRHVRALTIGQVEDGLGRNGGHHFLRRFAFNSGFSLDRGRYRGIDIDAGYRHHAGGQHHQIGLRFGIFVQDQILELDRAGVAIGNNLGNHTLGEDDAAILRRAVEVFAIAGRAQIGEQHHGIDVRIAVLEVGRLLDAGVAAEAGAVLQVLAGRITLAGALHEHHGLDRLAVARTADRLACGCGFPGQGFQTGLINHVGRLAVGKLGQLVGVIQRETCRLDDRADVFLCDGAGFDRDLDLEAARRAIGLGDGGVQVNLDIGIGFDARGHVGNAVVFRRLERLARRHALVQLGGPAAERAGFLDQHNLVASLRRLQRGSHAGHAATDHQQGLHRTGLLVARRHGHRLDFGAGHADIVFRHFLGGLARFLGIRTNPDHAFTQVATAHRDGGEIERLGLGAARTGAQRSVRDAFILDVVPDHRHALGGTEEVVLAHEVHLAGFGGGFDQSGGIETSPDLAAFTDICSSFRFSHVLKPPRGRLC